MNIIVPMKNKIRVYGNISFAFKPVIAKEARPKRAEAYL